MRALVLASSCLAAACAAPPPLEPPARTALVDLSPAEFLAAGRLLAGFDAESAEPDWRAGDTVLFGLRLRRGEDMHRWLLLLSVQPSPIGMSGSYTGTVTTADGPRKLSIESSLMPVEATVHDALSGTELGRTQVQLPSTLMGRGIRSAAERAAADAAALAAATDGASGSPPPVDLASVKAYLGALLTMMALLQVVQDDEVLAPYLWRVVEKPGLLSVLASFGVSVVLNCDLTLSLPATAWPPHLPPGEGTVVPVRIDVNDSPALLADLLVIEPRRPYALCGGIVAAQARHPSDPQLRFDIALLAARLGAAQASER